MSYCFDLSGRRAFVTGGSRGLGRAMALGLARAGADVALVAREAEALADTAAEIEALGRKVWRFYADMSRPETAEDVCARVLAEVGAVDIVINNVGGRRENIATEDMEHATWAALIDLNLSPTIVCSRVLGRAMIEEGRGGRIINVASINGFAVGRGIGGRHYETAKAAVIQFTRTLAADWAGHGITANAICPGLFATEPNMNWQRTNPEIIDGILAGIPMGRMGDPEDLGALAVYLCSDAAGFMTGASLVIDGGKTCH